MRPGQWYRACHRAGSRARALGSPWPIAIHRSYVVDEHGDLPLASARDRGSVDRDTRTAGAGEDPAHRRSAASRRWLPPRAASRPRRPRFGAGSRRGRGPPRGSLHESTATLRSGSRPEPREVHGPSPGSRTEPQRAERVRYSSFSPERSALLTARCDPPMEMPPERPLHEYGPSRPAGER